MIATDDAGPDRVNRVIYAKYDEGRMREVATTEFTRNFGLYREIVQREPVAVTSHGRATGYFVSAAEYQDLQRYKQIARQSLSIAQLAPDDVASIAAGRMGPEHDDLNSLLDD